MQDYWNILSQQLKPRLHEISAYLIALSFGWLLAFHSEFRQGFLLFFTGFGSMSPLFMALGLIVSGGLLLSFIHVFINRKKSNIEKFLIGWFVLGTSSFVSFILGGEMLSSKYPSIIILPFVNIFMSGMLLFQMSANKYDLLDEDASITQVAVSTIILLAFLLFSDLYLHLSWALLLSLCIFYSTTIVFLISWVFGRHSPNQSDARF